MGNRGKVTSPNSVSKDRFVHVWHSLAFRRHGTGAYEPAQAAASPDEILPSRITIENKQRCCTLNGYTDHLRLRSVSLSIVSPLFAPTSGLWRITVKSHRQKWQNHLCKYLSPITGTAKTSFQECLTLPCYKYIFSFMYFHAGWKNPLNISENLSPLLGAIQIVPWHSWKDFLFCFQSYHYFHLLKNIISSAVSFSISLCLLYWMHLIAWFVFKFELSIHLFKLDVPGWFIAN